VNLPADGKKVDQGFMNPGVGVMAMIVEESPEGIFKGPGVGGVGVGFYRGHVDNVFALKVIRDAYPLRENLVQRQRLELRLVDYPAHICFFKVKEHRDLVPFVDGLKL